MTTFGIEIEVLPTTRDRQTLTTERIANALNAHGISASHQDYNHRTQTVWKVITDGSCGYEVVSPVLDPRDGEGCYEQIVKVCTALNSIGCRVNNACGLHVHLYIADKSPAQVGRFFGMWMRMEHLIDKAMPKSRRESHNEYCSSVLATLRRGSDGWYATSYRGQDYFPEDEGDRIARINELIGRSRNVRSFSDLTRLTNPRGDRYFKVNMLAYERQGTIEVRHHSGTTNATKIIMWVRFLQSMLRRAETSTFVRNLQNLAKPAGSDWARLWAMDDPQAVEHLKRRIKRFEDLEAAEYSADTEDAVLASGA